MVNRHNAFAGINGTGFAIVVIVALINATRRTINFVRASGSRSPSVMQPFCLMNFAM
jgi:hypothetical protein